MSFASSIKICFSKYAVFSGRASRSEYWWFALFLFIAGIVTSIIDVMIMGYSSENFGPINAIFSVITFLPGLAVGARRLHDIDRSGWWQLTAYIPYVGLIASIILIVIWCTEGEKKTNEYGKPIKLKR